MVRTLFLGLDGATWTVLGPLIDQGKLPHLSSLVDNGRAGPLRSCDPPVTFPAWKVITTGQEPAALGVFGIRGANLVQQRFTYPDARAFGAAEVWDYLAAGGLDAASVHMPTTWPVRAIGERGSMVAGPYARDGNLSSPGDLVERLGLPPLTTGKPKAFRGDPQAALDALTRLEGERFAVSRRLAPDVDVLFHTVFYCDSLQHFHWLDPATLEAGWTWIDREVGKLLGAARPETVVVASDHGFAEAKAQFNVNAWLHDQGLLALRDAAKATRALGRLPLGRAELGRVAERFGVDHLVDRFVPQRLRDAVPESNGRVGGKNVEALIDWHTTRAMSPDGHQVVCRDEAARQQVLEGLRDLALPDTGEHAIVRIVEPTQDASTPIVLTPHDNLRLAPTLGGRPWAKDDLLGGWQGVHAQDGIAVVSGDAVPPGELRRAHLRDIAPTLLGLAGCSVPSVMAGRTLVGTRPATIEPLPAPGVALA